jgi:hypothetical protein
MLKKFSPNTGPLSPDNDYLYGLIIQEVLKTQGFTCQNTATQTPTTPLINRKTLEIFNNGNTVVYYGASDVSTSNGRPIYPHSSVILQIEDTINVFTISAAGGEDLRLVEGN